MIDNYKGGSAKTQTAIELGYWLMKTGYKVLMVDMDHQANLTNVLTRYKPSGKRTLSDILIDGGPITHEDISTRDFDGEGSLDYVESGLGMGRLERRLPDDIIKEYILKDALEEIRDDYDFIIIDTPPSADIAMISALVASNDILMPTKSDSFDTDGIDMVMPVISKVKSNRRLNPDLSILGILVTVYEGTNTQKDSIDYLKRTYGELVIPTPIRKCVKVIESNKACTAVQAYAPKSTSAEDYRTVFAQLFGNNL